MRRMNASPSGVKHGGCPAAPCATHFEQATVPYLRPGRLLDRWIADGSHLVGIRCRIRNLVAAFPEIRHSKPCLCKLRLNPAHHVAPQYCKRIHSISHRGSVSLPKWPANRPCNDRAAVIRPIPACATARLQQPQPRLRICPMGMARSNAPHQL